MLEIPSTLIKGDYYEEKVQSSGDRRKMAEMLGG
jgi:hypothetical protein